MTKELKLLITLAVLSMLGAGCDNRSNSATVTRPAVMALTDAESAAVLGCVNMGEVQTGRQLMPLGANSDVLAFAQLMIDSHTEADARARGVLGVHELTPQPNAVSDAIDADVAALSSRLTNAEPGLADPIYMNSQVAMHQQVLLLIDCAILPGMQNDALKGYVSETLRPAVRQSFEQANRIVGMLESRNEGAGFLTVSMRAFGCDAACDPEQKHGFSVGMRDAACSR